MNPRFVQADLSTLLAQFPAVVLLGPRQAGKTTLALAEAAQRGDALYLDLELPSAQRQLDDPEAFLTGQHNRLVILDEVQRLPELFAVLRELDATGVKLIWVENPPEGADWDGVRDRLQRAAAAG